MNFWDHIYLLQNSHKSHFQTSLDLSKVHFSFSKLLTRPVYTVRGAPDSASTMLKRTDVRVQVQEKNVFLHPTELTQVTGDSQDARALRRNLCFMR